jgi:hypothetical protein
MFSPGGPRSTRWYTVVEAAPTRFGAAVRMRLAL